jgi:hypothetical protein
MAETPSPIIDSPAHPARSGPVPEGCTAPSDTGVSSFMFRQLITCTAVAAAMGMSFSAAAQGAAAEYPNKPVRMIVPFPPGGGTDILARVVSNKLTEVSKWTVVPDNRAGAGGTIGIT